MGRFVQDCSASLPIEENRAATTMVRAIARNAVRGRAGDALAGKAGGIIGTTTL